MAALSPLYESLRSVGKRLQQLAPGVAVEQSIVDEEADIERLQLDTDSLVTDKLQQMECTSRLWDEVEAGMESILEQSRKTQTSLMQSLSDNYGDLERELCCYQVCDALLLLTWTICVCVIR